MNNEALSLLSRYYKHQPVLAEWFDDFLAAANAEWSLSTLNARLGKGLVIEDADEEDLEHALEGLSKISSITWHRYDVSDVERFAEECAPSYNAEIVLLDAAPWLTEPMPSAQEARQRRRLIKAVDSPGDRRIFIIMCEDYADLDVSMRRSGRFDRYFEWEELNPTSAIEVFFERADGIRFSDDVKSDLGRLGSLLCVRFPDYRRIGLLCSALKRIGGQCSQVLQWNDLLELAVGGTGQGARTTKLRDEHRVAVHEAGHAIVYMASNNWEIVPDFVSITPARSFFGVMAENFAMHHERSRDRTMVEAFREIKTLLGGRAAEQLLLGPDNVGLDAATNDFEFASKLAFKLVSLGATVKDGQLIVSVCATPPGDSNFCIKHRSLEAQNILKEIWVEVCAILKLNLNYLINLSKTLQEKKVMTGIDFSSQSDSGPPRNERVVSVVTRLNMKSRISCL